MKLLPVNLTDPGKIKRIRGIAYAMRVAPAICNRMVETAKGVLLKFIPDVYIVSDHQKAANAGNSPAFGLTLVAETINGTFLCAEACSQPKGSITKGPNIPEEIAMDATNALLEEIYRVIWILLRKIEKNHCNLDILRVDVLILLIRVWLFFLWHSTRKMFRRF